MTLFELSNYYSRALAKIKNFPDRSSKTRALTLKQTQDLLASYPEFRNELFCSKQRLQHIRNERLRKILIYAKSYSPWYQKSLAHIDVENFREERLSEIPVMNKNILMENWNEIVTDRKLSLAHAEKHIAKMRCDKDTLYLNNLIMCWQAAAQVVIEECMFMIGMNGIISIYLPLVILYITIIVPSG